MRKLSCVVMLILFVAGCSYTGNLERGFHKIDNPVMEKSLLSAAIVNTKELQDFRVQEYTGGYTFTFYINPAFNEGLEVELNNVFSRFQLVKTESDLDGFDIQIIPLIKFDYVDGTAWTGQYKYRYTLTLKAKDIKSNSAIEEFSNTQELIFSPSASSTVLSALTGASLFLLSPITIPIQTQVAGDDAIRVIEEGVSRSFKSLSYQISNCPKLRQPQQQSISSK